jgi:DNA-binding LacI/PurR family transcriptional regulator
MPNPTLRTLAKSLGLSRTTISDALRGSPRVRQETVERVMKAAQEAGYHRNPLTGAVMSLLRRSSGQEFRGVIAALEIVPPDRPDHAQRYSDAVMAGIVERAGELGFKVEKFEIKHEGPRLERLDTILHTRGIQALVILPAIGFPDFSALDWSRYTGVYTDYFIDQPPLHCVCSDHYRSMVALLQRLHSLGYKRPGLVIDIQLDERLQFRWEGAFVALQKYLTGITEVPPLRLDVITREAFSGWFKEHDPDVVLCHEFDAINWMRELGARIPESHGFVCLNSMRASMPCAALDLQTSELGARAVELATAQLLHNEMGVPHQPSLTTIPALWVDGPTVRDLRLPYEPASTIAPRPATRRKGTRSAAARPRQRSVR